MEQQSQAWLEWRNKGIGSSDAPVIMGVSPWKTERQLWEEKRGIANHSAGSSYITRKGNAMEPKARAHYELLTGRAMPPRCFEHYSQHWLRASMDGFNDEENIGLEIKFAGAKDHLAASNGRVPEKYYPQVQHQLIVTGANWIDYFSYDGHSGAIVQVLPDMPFIESYLLKASMFWSYVSEGIAPNFTRRDYVLIRDNTLRELCDEWANSAAQSEQRDHYYKALIFAHERVLDRRVRCGSYLIDPILKTIEMEGF